MNSDDTFALAASCRNLLLASLALAAMWTLHALFLLLQDAGLTQDGHRAEPWTALALEPFWVLLVSHVLSLALLAAGARALVRLHWGRDVTLTEAGWQDSDGATARASATAPLSAPLTEPPARAWCIAIAGIPVLLVVCLVGYTMLTVLFGEDPPRETWPLLLLPCMALAVFIVHAAVASRTRRIEHDEYVLMDSSFWRTRRIPWSLVQVRAEARTGSHKDRHRAIAAGHPMRQRCVWTVTDMGGREVARLGDDLLPSDRFSELRQGLLLVMQRSDRSAPARGPAAHMPAEPRTTTTGLSGMARNQPADPLTPHEHAYLQPAQQPPRPGLASVLAAGLAMAPFVLGSLFMTGQSLWFQLVAARADGIVVAVERDPLPSLLVEYHTADGAILRTGSDGSDTYVDFAVGDRITVFYDPASPTSVRLDLFLELWLLPMILGGLTLLLLLVLFWIARSARARHPA